jgi:TetR/AcrR family transcriptional regulator, copper-responsive repressor
MEQKSASKALPKRRGRPPKYDPDIALARATELFWKHGYAAVSLDDLAHATGMNRPSLSGAFGDKRSIYLRTLERYRNAARAQAKHLLAQAPDLRAFLRRFYAAAIDVYVSGDDVALGCYSIGTAATQAATDPDVRGFLLESIRATDALLTGLFRKAAKRGEIPSSRDPATLGRLATATQHTLALRARVGVSRRELRDIANATIEALCTGEAVDD